MTTALINAHEQGSRRAIFAMWIAGVSATAAIAITIAAFAA
jgi:hypothetical protein